MTLARPEYDRSHFQVVRKPHRKIVASEDRFSDVWPDWSTELSVADLAKIIEKNKPSVVLREAAGAIVYSIGLIILLMVVLSVLHVR